MPELVLDEDQVERILRDYRRDGVAFNYWLPDGMMNKIRSHLDRCQQYPGHVKAVGEKDQSLEHIKNSMGQRCYAMADVIKAPGFFKTAMKLAPMARKAFEVEIPRLYSLNAFWTFPSHYDPGLMGFHTDNDDRKQMVMFVFGTDVLTDDDGPHIYKSKSGRDIDIYGPRGSVFITDTSRLHKGLQPRNNPRLLLWARWGISNPPDAYGWDRLSPVPKEEVLDYPDDPWLQECVKLVAS